MAEQETELEIVADHIRGSRRVGISGFDSIGVPTDEAERVCSEVSEQIDRRTISKREVIGTAYWDGERLTYEVER